MDEVLMIESGRVRFLGVSTSFFIKIAWVRFSDLQFKNIKNAEIASLEVTAKPIFDHLSYV